MFCLVFAFVGWEGAVFLLLVLPPAILLISVAQWLCSRDRRHSMVSQIREVIKAEQVELSDADASKITKFLLKKMDRSPGMQKAADEQHLVNKLVAITEHRLPVSLSLIHI